MNDKGQGRALPGVGLVALATFFFASADTLTKQLAPLYGVALVVAVRYLVNLVLMGAVWGPSQGWDLWRTERSLLVILRGLCLAAASLTMALALKLMPVAETVAIIYLAPIAVMIVAWRLLGEAVNLAGWLGAGLGFVGVLLIVRPGAGLDPWGVTLALINAALSTCYHILTRILSRSEKTPTLLAHAALTGTLVFGVMLVLQPPTLLPGLVDAALMVALGALMTAGYFLFTSAYREAPASLLAPVNYLHLAWAALLGWLVFGHAPDAVTALGMALVVLAGIAVALRSQFGQDAEALGRRTP